MNKEVKVFVVSSEIIPDGMNISAEIIMEWNDVEFSPEAETFVEMAKQENRVFTLQQFQNAFNFNNQMIYDIDDYIFITDNY